MQRDEQTPPVSPGDELDVLIESVGEKGDGVAKKSGFVIFVPKALKGQALHIKITKGLKSVAFSENLGEAKGPVVNQPREFKPRAAYQQPKREEQINLEEIGEGSEEF
jgi:predicted RNA-binding protein with TRAM domain